MKRILAFLLAALMLVSVAACGKTEGPTKDTTPSGPTDTNAPDTDPDETDSPFDPGDVDDLPKDLYYDGADFIFCGCGRDYRNTVVDMDDVVDRYSNAVYEQTLYVAERLGVRFEEKFTAAWADVLRAGDDTYKLVHHRGLYIFDYAAEGLAYLWSDIDTVDLDKNYWFDKINANLTIGGKLITAAGAYNISSYCFTHAILFNKQLIKDYTLEDPYQLVRDGKWTWEKFAEFGVKATYDLDGNGRRTEDDAWGFFVSPKEAPQNFTKAANVLILSKDEDDYPVYTLDSDEHFLDVFTKIFELLYDRGFWKYTEASDGDIPETGIRVFNAGRALMIDSTFSSIRSFRDMDADFGVIPYPKYDEEQDEYYSCNSCIYLPMIPSTLSPYDAQMTGAVIEAMSSYAIRYTIPEYYEVLLKTKLARDEESGEMFDIIMENRVFDPGLFYIPDVERLVRDLFWNDKRGRIVSDLARKAGTFEVQIEELITNFENNVKSIHG